MSQPILPQGRSASDDDLQKFEQTYGPFDPPAAYQFEPELRNPPPRPIPVDFRQGRYCRKRRMGLIGLFTASLVLMACSLLPIMRIWALYVLPLGYLRWIAAAMLLGTGVGWLRYLFGRGPFIYVEEGIPLVARIAALFLRTKLIVNGSPSVFQYVALLQHRDPQTGEVVLSAATYDISATAKDTVTLSYHVGDYVTAVYLNSDPKKTLRLYGFLDLRPGFGVIPVKQVQQWGVLKLIGVVVGVGAFFFSLGWSIYAMGKFEPLDASFRAQAWPFALGAATLGVALIAFVGWNARKKSLKVAEANRHAMAEGRAVEIPPRRRFSVLGLGVIMGSIFSCGALLMGGLIMLCWAITLNALCDSSPAVERPMRVRELWMTTHNFLFREYKIEYELTDDRSHKKREMMATPWQMIPFLHVRTGVARVRQGFLGWPWVETLTPDEPKALPVGPPQPPDGGRQ